MKNCQFKRSKTTVLFLCIDDFMQMCDNIIGFIKRLIKVKPKVKLIMAECLESNIYEMRIYG